MRGIHIQRPIIVTEKQKVYGDVFHATQGHQHAYECVQPLQGLVTFGEPEDGVYARNNYSYFNKEERPSEETPSCPDWDYAIYTMLGLKFCIGIALLWEIEIQTAYNDIHLTNFRPSSDSLLYSIQAAGTTNPLYCLLIALSLVIFSVIVGLTSSKKYMLGSAVSCVLLIVLFILQATAIGLHITMLVKQNVELGKYCLTNMSMILLHGLTVILSLWGLAQLAMAPQSKQAKRNEVKIDIDSRVQITENEMHEPINGVSLIGDRRRYEESKDITLTVTDEDIYRETTANFWLCVVEDLNTIVCYAFVVRACDAQSAIHDDSTIFFDVLCIVFLGFLQHVANILMIFHAHIEKHTKLQMKGKTEQQKTSMQEQLDELVTFIARTRLLLFFMIGITVVFFYLRISPTYEENAMAIPYEILRVLALITMVSLNTLHSAWYEFQNS